MKKMFNLAVAIVAMSSAISLTSCDKLFGSHNDGDSLNDDTLTEQATTDSTNVDDSTEAATLDDAAAEPEAEPATDAEKK